VVALKLCIGTRHGARPRFDALTRRECVKEHGPCITLHALGTAGWRPARGTAERNKKAIGPGEPEPIRSSPSRTGFDQKVGFRLPRRAG
jgi:hypothetical protein